MNHKIYITKSARILLPIATAFFIFCALAGCVKKEDVDFDRIAGTSWNPDVAIPLVHSKLGLDRIAAAFDSGTYNIDSNHFVTLIYKGNVLSVYGYQYLKLDDPQSMPDQNINLTSPEILTLSTNNTVTTQRSNNYPLGVTGGEHLDSMTLGQGMLNISISSIIKHSGTLNVSMPTAKLHGIPFSRDIPFTFINIIPIMAAGNFDLTGYDLDLTSTGSFNVLPVVYTVTFNNSGNPTFTSETFTIKSDFSGMVIKEVFGDFGQHPFPFIDNDSSRISLFNNVLGGNAYFDDPKVRFNISNSFGMTFDAHFDSLYAYKFSTGVYTNIIGFPNPIPILTPTVPGLTAYSTFTLDQTNSNVKDIINNSNNYIGYDVSATTNPGGNTHNFIQDSSLLKIDVNVELPLYGYADGFVVQDTADFHIESIEEIEWASFRLNITNGFPIDAITQVYFVDSTYTVLDSLISPLEQVINSGVVDAVTGKVTAPTLKTTDEYFSKDRLQHIYNAEKVLIKGVMNSYQYKQPFKVKIYSDYILDVRIGVRAQLKLNNQ